MFLFHSKQGQKQRRTFLDRVSNEATKFNHPISPPNSSCVSTPQTQLCSEKGEHWQFAILNKDKRKTMEKIKS